MRLSYAKSPLQAEQSNDGGVEQITSNVGNGFIRSAVRHEQVSVSVSVAYNGTDKSVPYVCSTPPSLLRFAHNDDLAYNQRKLPTPLGVSTTLLYKRRYR